MASKTQKTDGYPLPEVIDGHELICVSLMIPNDPDYVADFRGHMAELGQWMTWEKSGTPGDTRASRAAAYWRELLHAHLVIGDCGPKERTCTDYAPSAPIVSYFPVDPFKDPDARPFGYLLPPFTVVQSGDLINSFLGYLPGDVITTISRIPLSSLGIGIVSTIGLPKIGIKLPTGGDLTLKLLSIESGGLARVFVDGKQVAEEDLEYLELQFPVQSTKEIEVELTLEKGQPHTVTIQFEPKLTLAPPFLGFGGGLRSFTFCTEETVKETPYITECEDEMNLRINPDKCWIIQAQCSDGTWQDWYDPTCDAASGIAGGSQPGEQPPLAKGDCQSWPVTLRANDVWRLPVPVGDGDVITVTGAKGMWNDGGESGWHCPSGQPNVLGFCVGSGGPKTGDPSTFDHMALIVKYASTYASPLAGAVTIPGGTGAQSMDFMANDSDLSNNKGSILFNVEICKAADPATLPENQTWCYTIDFTQFDGGFSHISTLSPTGGHYVLGQGWESDYFTSGTDTAAYLYIGRDLGVNWVLKHIDVTYDTRQPYLAALGASGIGIGHDFSGAANIMAYELPTDGGHTRSLDVNLTLQKIAIYIALDQSAGSGSAKISRLVLSGTGANPFGNNNC